VLALAPALQAQTWEEAQKSVAIGKIVSRRIDPGLTVVPTVDTSYGLNPKTKVAMKAGLPVTFYRSGFVASGTLAQDAAFLYNGKSQVAFKAGTEVWFFETSFAWRGTIQVNATFPINPKGSVSRAAGAVVSFNPEGFLVP
jgi:hypothetical protein